MLLLVLCVVVMGVQVESVEVMITMRDGVQLHTAFDFPLVEPTNLTAVIDRSPYGMNAIEQIADLYLLLDMVGVRQDMRGTGQSGGNFTIWHNAANDSYDTMKFISEQSWSSGAVLSVGASADGIASYCEILDQPPWLQAQTIIFATADGRLTMFPGGAYRQELIEGWLNKTVPSQAAPLIELIKRNEGPTSWWDAVSASGKYWMIKDASVQWSGWYDIFLIGNLQGFYGYQYLSDPSVRGKSKLVVDPLGHCQKAAKYFPKNLIDGRVGLPVFLSFDLFGGDSHAAEGVKAVTFYVMGAFSNSTATGGYWTTLDDFPQFTDTPYYIHSDGSLSTTAPSSSELPSTSYKYDPTNPVPTVGGNNLLIPCGPLDQTPVENRSDVLVFTSEPLTAPLAVTGPLDAYVYVSGSTNDTDFVVKLTDVSPVTGESNLIQDGILRMRWRDNLNSPQPMNPGTVYKIKVSLWNTSFVFDQGHRIRVTISSSNVPRFEPNPNTGVPLVDANSKPPIVATNTIYHSSQYPSYFNLPVVNLADLPPHGILNDKRAKLKFYKEIVQKRMDAGVYSQSERRMKVANRFLANMDVLISSSQ